MNTQTNPELFQYYLSGWLFSVRSDGDLWRKRPGEQWDPDHPWQHKPTDRSLEDWIAEQRKISEECQRQYETVDDTTGSRAEFRRRMDLLEKGRGAICTGDVVRMRSVISELNAKKIKHLLTSLGEIPGTLIVVRDK